jgi:peroxiredoxin
MFLAVIFAGTGYLKRFILTPLLMKIFVNPLATIGLSLFTVLALTATSNAQAPAVATTSSTTAIPDEDRGYLVKVGDQAPDDFELILQDGSKTSLKELRGKTVVLQFTASWCSVCRKEMPHLEQMWQSYKDKNVVLIGVDRDEPLETVKKFHKDMKITYPLALDPGADIFGRFAHKKSGVTRNVVIDATGKIVYLTRLYDEKEFADMVRVIDTLAQKS